MRESSQDLRSCSQDPNIPLLRGALPLFLFLAGRKVNNARHQASKRQLGVGQRPTNGNGCNDSRGNTGNTHLRPNGGLQLGRRRFAERERESERKVSLQLRLSVSVG